MRGISWTGALLLALSMPSLCATRPNYEAGKIVSVEQKTRSQVLYYLVNTPVEKEEPYYEISVQVKGTVYTGEYSPRHAVDSPPDDWLPGVDVQTRVEKHYIFIKRPYGDDLRLLTTEHRAALTSAARTTDSPSKKQDGQPPK